MRQILIVTALSCEATPLVEAWGLKPMRGTPLFERFQVSTSPEGLLVAVTGIGKLRAASATAALASALTQEAHSAPLMVNLGIAGALAGVSDIGAAYLVNKIRDVATNTRFYPDVLVRHPLPEASLETHDKPVDHAQAQPIQSDTRAQPLLVDMEASGFMQAATLLTSPSEIAVIKIASDLCNGTRITPAYAKQLVTQHVQSITNLLFSMRESITPAPTLSPSEMALIESVADHARFSHHQCLEITRASLHCKAKGIVFTTQLQSIFQVTTTSKPERTSLYRSLLRGLQEATLP